MIEAFTLSMPASIRFGPGERRSLPDLLSRHGSRVLLITGSSWFRSSARGREILELLGGFTLETLTCPPGEPASDGLNALLEHARAFRPEAILAVGGGSVLDTAKALSGLLPLEGRVDDFLEGAARARSIPGPGVPWVAVPTTSGTGAEVTYNAVVRSAEQQAKRSIRSPWLLAAHAVVDPELTLDCPPAVTGISGLDALTQLVESYVSRKSRPVPRALVRQAAPVMLEALHRLAEHPADLGARTGAAYGSMISGIALANSGLGAAHGFAAGLGGRSEIPHGLICAVALGPVLAVNASVIRDDLAELFGRRDHPVEWLQAETAALLRAFGLPTDLKGYHIDPALIPEIARGSSGSSMSGNPVELSQERREAILRELV